jgi:hypothetical protein
MTNEQQPNTPPETAEPPEPGDYGYDLAHEMDARPSPAAAGQPGGVYVATESTDHDQDLSYDLAHDIPPAGQPY